MALSLVATPLAMNLNLDDRLAPDAVEMLELELLKNRAVAAGGEWKICYSQAETDRGRTLLSGPSPPLRAGLAAQAGHAHAPRQRDGQPRHARPRHHMADGGAYRNAPLSLASARWNAAARRRRSRLVAASERDNPNFKVLAVPMVIGNYHSHPEGQAEFRHADERALLGDPGVSLM